MVTDVYVSYAQCVFYCIVYSRFVITRYQPTEEEREMYKKYKGDKSLLQNADTFLMKVYL